MADNHIQLRQRSQFISEQATQSLAADRGRVEMGDDVSPGTAGRIHGLVCLGQDVGAHSSSRAHDGATLCQPGGPTIFVAFKLK